LKNWWSKMNEKTTNIYWSPCVVNNKDLNWEILYPSPTSLYDSYVTKKTTNKPNMFSCPAFSQFAKNVFIFKNPMDANFIIDDNSIYTKKTNYVSASMKHQNSIEDCSMVEYGLSWLFFAEDDDVDITVTSPFFDCPKHLSMCNLVPGKFSISNWFRSVNTEFILKPGVKTLEIEENEPIMSVMFNTNKRVNLVRFEMNDKLLSCAATCSRSSEWESWVPLLSRYKRFKESQMRKIVLKHIKENLIGD